MDRARVWMVDDSALSLEHGSRALEDRFDVECFRSGASMLEALEHQGTPDLLVLDWLMPEMSGRDVCLFVRERANALELPIIIVTAGRENVVEGLEAGANDYVTKPYMAEELDARVATLVALRQAHAKLAAAEEELRVEAIFRERFIGILAHDLRQPLHAMTLAMQLLDRHTRTRSAATAGPGLRAARRMNRMVEDLLDLTRSRSGGGIPVLRTEAMLVDIVRRVVDDHSEHAAIALVSEGDTRGAWDADRMTQVCENLIGNALGHGAPGRPIAVRVIGLASEVVLEVHNEGLPIAAEDLRTLFDPFRRGSPPQGQASSESGRPPRAGLGLGLFIVDQIVRAHGGTVSVKSNGDAHGTTFVARIPRAPSMARLAM